VAVNPSNIQSSPPGHEQRPAGGWRHPFVLNVVPFLTSLGLHLGLIIIGLLTLKVFQAVVIPMVRVQTVMVEAPPVVDHSPEGVLHAGLGDDFTRRAAQDKFPDVPPDAKGLTDRKGLDLRSIPGGGSDERESDLISRGPNALLGRGGGIGPGSGTGIGPGSGELSGAAPFGIPRGGSGPGTGIFKDPKVARKVVYLCDASGTMITVFDKLREELTQSIDRLRPTQSFSVVLFSDNKAIVLDKSGLLMATPENKRRAAEFVGGVVARGSTNPLPAIREALRMEPELIHCLTDGFDQVSSFEAVAEEFRRLNRDSRVRVNTLLIEGSDLPELRAVLQRIAAENGGVFKALKEGDW
jgi:hypothetical protein